MATAAQPARTQRFRAAIQAFITQRKQDKLKDKEDPETAAKYDYGAWLKSAAERVAQIHAVSHIGKATHPDAKGGNLLAPPASLPRHAEVGSHSLPDDAAPDVVGNAAALDVFKFLSVQVESKSLLHWAETDDPDFAAALHPDATIATGMLRAFRSLGDTDAAAQTDALAKQLYWLVGDDPNDDSAFHLVQPLFASPLMQAVHADIQAARLGEANKLARQAYREHKPFEGTYVEYRHLASRKLGGSKPQNVSQLNSERGGINYLLSAAPPLWRTRVLPQLDTNSKLWRAFLYFGQVRDLLDELAQFLLSNPPDTMRTRRRREGLEQAVGAWLPPFAEHIQNHAKPGWTRADDCELDACLKLWLEPPTGESPEVDRAAYDWGDWADEVAGLFAVWVNSRLRDTGLKSLGDVEYRHFARQAIVEAAWPVPMSRRAPRKYEGAST